MTSAFRLISAAIAALSVAPVPANASRQVIAAISLPLVDPDAGVAACGGQYYITDRRSRNIYRINPKNGGTTTIFEAQLPGVPEVVTSAGRNECWFSFTPGVLAMLRPEGTFKPYYLPDKSNWLHNIAESDNGTVWFSLGRHSQIGYRTSTDVLRIYNLPMSIKNEAHGWTQQTFSLEPLIAPTPDARSDTYSFPLPVVQAITTDRVGNAYFLVAGLTGTPYIAKVQENAQYFDAIALSNELAFGFFVMADGTVVVATEPNVLLVSPNGVTRSIPLPHTQEHCRNRTSVQTASINPSRTEAYFTVPLEGKLYSIRKEHGQFRIRRVFAGTDCPAAVVIQDDGNLGVFDPTSQILTIVPRPH